LLALGCHSNRETFKETDQVNRKLKSVAMSLLLLLPGSIAWGQGYAYTASNYLGELLYGSDNLTPVVHVDAVTGNVLIQAKASLTNVDGSPQFANCQLDVRSPFLPASPTTLDTTYVRLDERDGGDTGSVALEGKFCGGPDMDYTVEMSCATYQGGVQDAVLTAVRVPGLDGCSSFPTQGWLKFLPQALFYQSNNGGYVPVGSVELLPGGNYVVSGKTSIINHDSDHPQDANCRLVAKDALNLNFSTVLDVTHARADIFFDGSLTGSLEWRAYEQPVFLQGTYCAPPSRDPVTFELDCATAQGWSEYAAVTAIKASELACALPPPM
jgi:hypothetical protein